MSISASVLVNAKYAASSDTSEYTVPSGKTVIIDKFTVTNTDASARTLNVNLIPSGGTLGASNLVVSALSVAAGATTDLTSLQNQILAAGDQLSCKSSSASTLVIRVSGRQIT